MNVSWQVANHMRAELPLDALQMALWRRRSKKDSGLIHHSDRLNPVSTRAGFSPKPAGPQGCGAV
ncbi:hypothetical protein [Streptomyces sp. ITFR-6]|uniref:hypothetical protein n=1 Tax=Streptomyces sp. ITFR-6 TaxID=3075197 RepID=UPI0037DA1B62